MEQTSDGDVKMPMRSRGSGARTVYASLRRDIIDLTLAPGSPLDETELSARFAMSRTPVREALVRLASEGLITALPNRNTIVSVIDFAGLPVYFDALTLMYRTSGRTAALHHTEDDLVRIRAHQSAFADSVERQDAIAMIESNREYHVAIAEAGRNTYYISLFTRLLDEGRRILRLYYSSFDDKLPRAYVKEHEDLIAAIAERDVDRADAISLQHAGQIVRQIQSYISRNVDLAIKL